MFISKLKQLKLNNKFKKTFKDPFHNCYYCKYMFLTKELTVEHITPKFLGGTNDWSNLTLSCRACNQKHGKEMFIENKRIRKYGY